MFPFTDIVSLKDIGDVDVVEIILDIKIDLFRL